MNFLKNISSIFFRFSLRNLLSEKFYKNPKLCWKFCHNLHTNLSQWQFFIFNLKSCKEVASLYSLGRFAQRNGVLFDIVSIPYFTVFLFSLDISWKFLIDRLCGHCKFSNERLFPGLKKGGVGGAHLSRGAH